MDKALIIKIIILVILIVIAGCILEFWRYLRFKYWDMKPNITSRSSYKKETRIVITMTTIPERINKMHPTIASLLDQSIKADEIALNLPWKTRKGKSYDIPKWLSEIKEVKIYRVNEDEGPATKLLPTLRRETNPDTKILVVDDDVIYNSKTLEKLLKVHDKRKCAVTQYGIVLQPDGSLPSTYSRVEGFFTYSRKVDLLQGFSGFLVTPSMFPKEVYDLKLGPKEAISVDDIWFSGWLAYNNIDIYTPHCTFLNLPIASWGDIRTTPALGKTENIGMVRDQKVINWFIQEQGVWKK